MRQTNTSKAIFIIAAVYSACVYLPMAAMSIGAGLVMTSWLILRWGHLKADLIDMRRSAFFWPSVALAGAMVWSLIWPPISGLTFFGMKPSPTLGDTAKLWHLAFPFILAALFSALPERELRRVTWFWFGCGVTAAIFGIVQHFVPLYRPQEIPQFPGFYHSTGFAAFHLSFAAIIVFPTAVAFAIAAVLARQDRHAPDWGRAISLAGAAAVLFTLVNVFTYSKIAWLALPVIALMIAFVAFRGWPRWALSGAVVALALVWAASPQVRGRFSGEGTWGTIYQRQSIWSANLEMVRQNPLFGVGWQQNSKLSEAYYQAKGAGMGGAFESHAHNNLLEQAGSTGLVGLAAFLWWSLTGFLLALKLHRKPVLSHWMWKAVGLGLAAGWVGLHVNGLTQANFWDAKVLHQIAWVTALTMDLSRRKGGARP